MTSTTIKTLAEFQPEYNRLRFDYDQVEPDRRQMVIEDSMVIHRQSDTATASMIRVGERLSHVKDLLPHGQFGEWLRVEFDMSERTAQNMMNVARRFAKSEIVSVLSDTVLYLLAAPSVPDEAVERVVAVASSGERITTARTKKIIADSKPDYLSVEELKTRILQWIYDRIRSDGGTFYSILTGCGEFVPSDTYGNQLASSFEEAGIDYRVNDLSKAVSDLVKSERLTQVIDFDPVTSKYREEILGELLERNFALERRWHNKDFQYRYVHTTGTGGTYGDWEYTQEKAITSILTRFPHLFDRRYVGRDDPSLPAVETMIETHPTAERERLGNLKLGPHGEYYVGGKAVVPVDLRLAGYDIEDSKGGFRWRFGDKVGVAVAYAGCAVEDARYRIANNLDAPTIHDDDTVPGMDDVGVGEDESVVNIVSAASDTGPIDAVIELDEDEASERPKHGTTASWLISVPPNDVNFKSALDSATGEEIRHALRHIQPEGNKVRLERLEARLRRMARDGSIDRINFDDPELVAAGYYMVAQSGGVRYVSPYGSGVSYSVVMTVEEAMKTARKQLDDEVAARKTPTLPDNLIEVGYTLTKATASKWCARDGVSWESEWYDDPTDAINEAIEHRFSVETAAMVKAEQTTVEMTQQTYAEQTAAMVEAEKVDPVVAALVDPNIETTTTGPGSFVAVLRDASIKQLETALLLLPESLLRGRGPVFEHAIKKRRKELGLDAVNVTITATVTTTDAPTESVSEPTTDIDPQRLSADFLLWLDARPIRSEGLTNIEMLALLQLTRQTLREYGGRNQNYWNLSNNVITSMIHLIGALERSIRPT